MDCRHLACFWFDDAVFPPALLFTSAVCFLFFFGLPMLSPAGIVDAQRKFGSSYYYFYHQLLFGILPGLLLAYLISRVKYDIWRKISLPILFGALFLMA